ncbi:unnamed protein product, partial [Staurois parvus]
MSCQSAPGHMRPSLLHISAPSSCSATYQCPSEFPCHLIRTH